MTERNIISVRVKDMRDSIDGDVSRVIERINEAVKDIPEEYRASAYLQHSSRCLYNDEEQYTYLCYLRPENDTEYNKRIAEEKQKADKLKEAELKQLQALMEKYGK